MNASGGAPDGPNGLVVTCWGTRGSIPSPGRDTAGYGGNTPCVEVRAGSHCLILDAGTGIRALGEKLARAGRPADARILITHFHWDHIQGFPFFQPLFEARCRLQIFGPAQHGVDIQSLFAAQMGPIYFPVPYEALKADMQFAHVAEGSWEEGGVRISAIRVRHTSFTMGYSVSVDDRKVCYIPDNELLGGRYDVAPDWRARLVEFVSGADVLFHDAMFTADEYPPREGWGHSTVEQALELAGEAGARRLHLFHHAPWRTDPELDAIVDKAREAAARRGIPTEVAAAREGDSIRLGGAS